MKKFLSITIFFTILLCAFHANAIILDPTTAFTLRSNVSLRGWPAESIDDTWLGGGFNGFMSTNIAFTDRTFAEFDLSVFDSPVQNATLDWASGIPEDTASTIYLSYYDADGVSSFSDWDTLTTEFTSFAAGNGPYSIDVTSLLNDNIGVMAFLGFSWTVESRQAFIDGSQAPVINYTQAAPVPEPSTIVLMGLGLAGLAGFGRKKFRR